MKILFYVIKEGKMQEVSKEEYDAFEGEKYCLPSTWRLMLVAEMLLPLRWET